MKIEFVTRLIEKISRKSEIYTNVVVVQTKNHNSSYSPANLKLLLPLKRYLNYLSIRTNDLVKIIRITKTGFSFSAELNNFKIYEIL